VDFGWWEFCLGISGGRNRYCRIRWKSSRYIANERLWIVADQWDAWIACVS
jgi:hypothetical protein